jgi:hypothetical protein
MKRKKVAVYIDGFNLYHGIKNLNKPHLKWLNLRSLADKFIDPKSEAIAKVYYFSAIATFMPKDTVLRHSTYIEALETFGIEFISDLQPLEAAQAKLPLGGILSSTAGPADDG